MDEVKEQPQTGQSVSEDRDLAHKVIDARRDSYEAAKRYGGYKLDRSVHDYEYELPKFQAKTFREHLLDRLTTSQDVSILDVGCGRGVALAELVRDNSGLKAAGISAQDFREEISDPQLRDSIRKVDYKTGDVQKLRSIFQGQEFDVVISDGVFFYLGDPLNALRQCYGILKPDGILFINFTGLHLPQSDVARLEKYWKDIGVEAEASIDGRTKDLVFAIQKGLIDKLPMPFKYSQRTESGMSSSMSATSSGWDYVLDESILNRSLVPRNG
ncbi:MAG: class I SAM-dependent methyltransferase [Candidatus Daviesbacteria bacterium]|nr:class I SAM-dependent methyltransferase [Candidatus Daviesbacteria bacterium]